MQVSWFLFLIGCFSVLLVLTHNVNYFNRDLERRIVETEMELAQAKSQGYLKNQKSVSSSGKKMLAVIGVYTGFGSHLKRNKFRGSWMPRGRIINCLVWSIQHCFINEIWINKLVFSCEIFFSFRWCFEKAWGKRSRHTLCDWSEVLSLT